MLYYVNKNSQSNGDHEVHKKGCSYFPDNKNVISLGHSLNCRQAVSKAKKIYPNVDGCYYCSRECHTR